MTAKSPRHFTNFDAQSRERRLAWAESAEDFSQCRTIARIHPTYSSAVCVGWVLAAGNGGASLHVCGKNPTGPSPVLGESPRLLMGRGLWLAGDSPNLQRGFACKVKNGYTNPYLSAVALYKCNASGKAKIIYCAEGRFSMLVSVQGVYRHGKIELIEPLKAMRDETQVVVTFLDPGLIDLPARGIDKKQTAELRARLATFSEDWDSSEMSIYDNYDAAKAAL